MKLLVATFVSSVLLFSVYNARSVAADKLFADVMFRGDPEENMNASQLITSKGYPCEEHTVQTEDGFLLGLQRIPYGKKNASTTNPRPVVFLQHGLLCSSTNWLTNLENESFAYILADAGFDVWLGNVRGNTYSRSHVSLNPNQDEFWEWSFDQMALYDLPAMVNYALKVSMQPQLYYIGHSQGTLMAFAQLPRNKELAKKIKTFFALGPVTTVGHVESPIKYLADLVPELQLLFKIFGVRDFLPNNEIINWLADHVCEKRYQIYCENILFIISGWDPQQLNQTRLPVYFHHVPAGTSVRNVIHFAQMIKSQKFQMYDYGSAAENLKYYNQSTAPLYYPENLTTPTALYWGGQDWLADPKDVQSLIPKIKNVLISNDEIVEFDHLDFIWGMDAPERVYHNILNTIQKQEESIFSRG
uniref:Lipase n=1 Tax=Saccoglossus kowalevskii TaxID=10224 RepID=A0ABM0GXX2_SACKO|nr:PREDICTED: lysosomal acid lipase/cholesteryl ester hydrolase-like [Saccoglossus kowalevskii]